VVSYVKSGKHAVGLIIGAVIAEYMYRKAK
jgi:hypothetical protein